MTRRLRAIVLAVFMAAPGMAFGAPSFTSVVEKHFEDWDQDSNGTLTPDEIDRLTVDPGRKGEEAAAIAALKMAMRAKTDPLASLARADVASVARRTLRPEPDQIVRTDRNTPPSDKAAPGKPAPNGLTPDQTIDVAPGRTSPDAPEDRAGDKGPDVRTPDATPAARPRTRVSSNTLEGRYLRNERVIRTAKRELFLDPTPDLDKLHQGRLGDCFFVSVVGAMVEREPGSVTRMITPAAEPEQGYLVTFANGKTVTVPALTDAEHALVSTTGDEGVWLAVLEKAFGAARMESRPEDTRMLSSTDAIARGGSTGTSIQYLTGHKPRAIRLRPGKKGRPIDPQTLRETVRSAIGEAMSAGRLAAAGTDDKPGVPGINPNHAYAIMGFDEQSQTLRLWNPHGNTFRPKGEPGLEHGYPTRGGRFEMPLADFLKTFRAVSIETAEDVAPADATR